MRRTDRLFELVQLFRGGRFWRGRDLATQLEVSLRTIYRDIDTLVASGVPIEGERGVGYILREPVFLPPLTLTSTELEALQLGMAFVAAAGDKELVAAARQLSVKIDAVLPGSARGKDYLSGMALYLPELPLKLEFLPLLRQAIRDQQVLGVRYERLDGAMTERPIRPLHLEYWGQAWTCTAWCELRADFRVFRIDRLRQCAPTGARFRPEPGKTLVDYMATLQTGA